MEKYLNKFPVIALSGCQAVDKTTLVRDLLKDRRKFLTLDDPAVLMAEQNPISFLEQDTRLTIDEAQKSPAIFPAIKRIVDQKRISGQFIITGSAIICIPFQALNDNHLSIF